MEGDESFEEGEIEDSDEDADPQEVDKNELKPDASPVDREPEPDPLDTYNVISRPSNEANSTYRQQKRTSHDSDEDDNSAVSSDEDTDLWKLKKSKYFSNRTDNKNLEISSVIKSPVRPKTSGSTGSTDSSFARNIDFQGKEKPKKVNNVWGSVLTEQSLTQTMGSIGVERKAHLINNYRDVEAYDFLKAREDDRPQDTEGMPDSEDPFNKVINDNNDNRKRSKRQHSKERQHSKDRDIIKRRKRYRTCNENDSDEVVIDAIVDNLNEQKRELIEKVVDVIGKKKAIQLMFATEDIEEEGGMYINDGTRRRTPGGVFIQLVKQDKDVSKDMVDEIFAEEAKKFNEEQKRIRKQNKTRIRQRRKDQVRISKMLPQNKLMKDVKAKKTTVDSSNQNSESESDDDNQNMDVAQNESFKSNDDDILNREEEELEFVLGDV